MTDPLFVADIGGTNARFAIAEVTKGGVAIRDVQIFRAEDFETVRDAASAYFQSIDDRPKRACFAAAGPMIDHEVAFTNSRWRLRRADIARPLGLSRFKIVNDFYALAAGVSQMPQDAFASVKDGEGVGDAPRLVVGPGTGLGQALIVPTPMGARVVATEGGHVSFAPYTAEEVAIREFIAREHPRVSVERLLSGRGLVNIHRALCDLEGVQRISLQADEITEAAVAGEYPIAVKAVDIFCAILGRTVGDAVLATGARGGVVLGGGILPKIKDIFLRSTFVERFCMKGRMSDYVAAVPVHLLIGEGAALHGAAVCLDNDE